MLRIRLRRTGKKKQPTYRVVVADQRSPRDGAFVEVVGQYNPRTEPSTLVLQEERVKYWLEHGAQPSETVHRLLHGRGLIGEPPKRPAVAAKAERVAAAGAAE
ncbi:MAG: 30S ribosomal protein S16 [Dehalococcoidia bacterium]|nr:30S ribosomal protein S16 [Dehalococcoidia bacterium]